MTAPNPLEGVEKPEELIAALRRSDSSFVRGSMQVIQRNPPNPYIVPLLKKALEKFRGGG